MNVQEIAKIPSTTLISECFTINQLALKVPDNGIVVEIGTGAGRVTMVLALAVAGKGTMIHTVDNYSENGKYDEYGSWDKNSVKKLAKKFNVEGHITFRDKASVAVASEFSRDTIDFLYLDGSHRYVDVCREIDAWYPVVKTGGIIAGHDFDPNCDDGRNVIKAIFDKLLINPDKYMQVIGRVWRMEK